MSETRKCVFAGTFDPPTVGHEQIVKSCLMLFDEVVVAVMTNTMKVPALSVEEREALLHKLFENEPRIKIVAYAGAVCDLLREEDTPFYVRGIRDAMDATYEMRDFYATKKLFPGAVGIFIPSEQETMQVSSTLVRNSVKFKTEWKDYVPEKIREDVVGLLEGRNV